MTYYEILGIRKTASTDEIKTAYKKLVKKYHPDVYKGDKIFAEKKTKEINEAYDILSDPDKKNEYDESLIPKTTTYTPPSYSEYKYNPTSSYYNRRIHKQKKYSSTRFKIFLRKLF